MAQAAAQAATQAATPAATPAAAPTQEETRAPALPIRWSQLAADREDRLVRGDQSTIDRCRATVYYGSLPGQGPTTKTLWLAGHDHCGFSTWRQLPIGATVTLVSSVGRTLRYRIVDRVHVPRQGGSSAGLIHSDLVLQTCEGSGTSMTYANLLT